MDASEVFEFREEESSIGVALYSCLVAGLYKTAATETDMLQNHTVCFLFGGPVRWGEVQRAGTYGCEISAAGLDDSS